MASLGPNELNQIVACRKKRNEPLYETMKTHFPVVHVLIQKASYMGLLLVKQQLDQPPNL